MSKVADAARELLVQSLTEQAQRMRSKERLARVAYSQLGPLRDSAQRLADVYARAAELFEQELGQIEFVEGMPPDPDPRSRKALELDAIHRGMPPLAALPQPCHPECAAAGMKLAFIHSDGPPAELVAPAPPPPERKTAKCWSGGDVFCKTCGGATEARDDEYGGLARGGDYEVFSCHDCRATTYIELPD